MIHFRHYNTGRLDPEKRFGIVFYSHPKRKTLDIYINSHVFVLFTGRSYGERY